MAGIISAWTVSVKMCTQQKLEFLHYDVFDGEVTAVVPKHDNRAIMSFKGSLILYCYTAPVGQQNVLLNACLKFSFGISGGGHRWGFSQSYLQSAYGTAESEYCFVICSFNISARRAKHQRIGICQVLMNKEVYMACLSYFHRVSAWWALLPARGLMTVSVQAGWEREMVSTLIDHMPEAGLLVRHRFPRTIRWRIETND